MIKKMLNSRAFILYVFPFCFGLLSVLSFQPFNLSFINFILLPIFFLLLVYIKNRSKSVYRKKPYRRNLFIFGY